MSVVAEVERAIAKLLTAHGVPRCADPSVQGAFGYYIISYENSKRISICYVESRGSKSAHGEQIAFRDKFGPILAGVFGEQGVRHDTIKLQIGGRTRSVQGLVVQLPR